jgi:hypothetical protein
LKESITKKIASRGNYPDQNRARLIPGGVDWFVSAWIKTSLHDPLNISHLARYIISLQALRKKIVWICSSEDDDSAK